MRKAIYFNKENEDLVIALNQSGKMEVFSDYICGLIRADLMGDKTVNASIHLHLEDIKSQLKAIKQQVNDAVSVASKPSESTSELLSMKSEPIQLEEDDVKALKEIESEPKADDAKKSLIFV